MASNKEAANFFFSRPANGLPWIWICKLSYKRCIAWLYSVNQISYNCLKLTIRFFFSIFSVEFLIFLNFFFFRMQDSMGKGPLLFKWWNLFPYYLPKQWSPVQMQITLLWNSLWHVLCARLIVIVKWKKDVNKMYSGTENTGNQTTYQLEISFKSKLALLLFLSNSDVSFFNP